MSRWLLRFAAGLCAAAAAGCATVTDTSAPPTAVPPPAPATGAPSAAATIAPSAQAIANAQRLAGAPGSATPPPGAPGASALRPFAEVVRDANRHPGLFPLWQRDDKVWIEIAPEQFDSPYFFSTNLDQGLGESHFYAGSMSSSLSRRFGGPAIVAFHKVGSNVQLISKNVKYTARTGSPEARAVAESFSDSLLGTAGLASQPHPERKSVLIEANALFFADLPGAASRLERAYRQSYAFDARNSSFRSVRAADDFVAFNVNAHYALARVANPAPGQPVTQPPSTVPDIRSLFLGFHYTLAKLPDEPMRPRAADARIGYFSTDRWDFTTDDRRIPIIRYVNRWRLEKKDPAAALSEPKQPIVFWIDRNVPDKYRASIRDGVLEWNKAFERLGYRDAIRVEIQPDDADFNTSDIRHASIRWITATRSSFLAIGPSIVDPRSGEILDADIGIDATSVRAIRSSGVETIPSQTSPAADRHGEEPYCTYAAEATENSAFALSLLEARGELMLDGAEAEAFIQARLKSTTMHEVGHTLGLTHNFRASTVYSESQLANREFTQRDGIAGSIMEYNPVNLALRGEQQGAYHMTTLGPYDYWAIEYGYREFAPDAEPEGLQRIAGRSGEPLLAFMADDTLYHSGLDPLANTFDLGADPLAFADRQLKLARELWATTQARTLKPDESYAILRRNFSRGLGEMRRGALLSVKYIGGLTLRSDRAGTGRAPLEPVPAAKQRAALALLADTIFADDSFRFPPTFLSRLSISDQDIDDVLDMGGTLPPVDLPVDQQVLSLHAAVLGPLLGPDIAQRLLNNELKVSDPAQALRLAELYSTLRRTIFSELRTGQDIAAAAAKPAAGLRDSRHRGAPAPGGCDAGRRAGAAARRGDRAARRSGGDAEAAKAVGRDRGARRRNAGHARRGTEGADAAPGGLMPKRGKLKVTLAPLDNRALANLTGPLDANLRQIEAALDVAIAHRGGDFTVTGATGAATQAATALQRFYAAAEKPLSVDDIQLGLVEIGAQADAPPQREDDASADMPRLRTRRADLHGRTPNQVGYLKDILEHDITFGIGPAGTGKTYLAVACAVDALERDAVKRIVLVRPAVEAGERLGFLPGDLAQKVDPYLRPLYDALYDLMGVDKAAKLFERTTIELAPLAYMRGRTLNHSFIILDEAQNTTPEQMKMFLTRIGFGTKAVITGDVTQIDLARGQKSGLVESARILAQVRGIAFRHFTSADVVRHPLVQKIVDAYDREAAKLASRPPDAR